VRGNRRAQQRDGLVSSALWDIIERYICRKDHFVASSILLVVRTPRSAQECEGHPEVGVELE
jgi:hypothetical protein